jgi:hypothetical protein
MSAGAGRFLSVALAAASLASAASAIPITYAVDRSIGPSVEGGTITVVGTVTVDDAGPTVTDWDLTITSTALGRSFTLDPSNSTFFSLSTTLTATPTQLTIDVGTNGLWGSHRRDDSISLRHEWFLLEENGLHDQASLDFESPDAASDFASSALMNPVVLTAVPEPAALAHLVAALAGLGALGVRERAQRSARGCGALAAQGRR